MLAAVPEPEVLPLPTLDFVVPTCTSEPEIVGPPPPSQTPTIRMRARGTSGIMLAPEAPPPSVQSAEEQSRDQIVALLRLPSASSPSAALQTALLRMLNATLRDPDGRAALMRSEGPRTGAGSERQWHESLAYLCFGSPPAPEPEPAPLVEIASTKKKDKAQGKGAAAPPPPATVSVALVGLHPPFAVNVRVQALLCLTALSEDREQAHRMLCSKWLRLALDGTLAAPQQTAIVSAGALLLGVLNKEQVRPIACIGHGCFSSCVSGVGSPAYSCTNPLLDPRPPKPQSTYAVERAAYERAARSAAEWKAVVVAAEVEAAAAEAALILRRGAKPLLQSAPTSVRTPQLLSRLPSSGLVEGEGARVHTPDSVLESSSSLLLRQVSSSCNCRSNTSNPSPLPSP